MTEIHSATSAAQSESSARQSLNTLVLSVPALQSLSATFHSHAQRLDGLSTLIDNNVARCGLRATLPSASLNDAIRNTCSAWAHECTREANRVRRLGDAAYDIAALTQAGDTTVAHDLDALAGSW